MTDKQGKQLVRNSKRDINISRIAVGGIGGLGMALVAGVVRLRPVAQIE